MSDYGVLAKMRAILRDEIKDVPIFFTHPENSPVPAVVLELEEIWNPKAIHKAKIKIKAHAWTSQEEPNETSLSLSQTMRRLWEGKSFDLKDGYSATIRLESMVIDLPSERYGHPRNVRHYYSVFIR